MGRVDLHEDIDGVVEFGGGVLYFLGESEGIDCVDECDKVGDLFDFVSLEVADHMPAYAIGDSDVS